MKLEDLHLRYDYDRVRNISRYLTAPSFQLTHELTMLYRPQFAAAQRIVFSCFDNIDEQDLIDFVYKLQKTLKFIDIGNYFVLIIHNRPGLAELLEVVRTAVIPYEEHCIQNEYYDVPVQPIQITRTALLNPPDTICAQPWISLDIGPLGKFRPCCFYNEPIKRNNGTDFHAETDSIFDVYNSDYMKTLREEFRQGVRPVGCSRCWKEEADFTESKRQLLKHRFKPFGFDTNWEQDSVDNLNFVSVNFGNTCNLKCRICSPDASSRIAQEQVNHLKLLDPKTHRAYQNLKDGRWAERTDAQLWSDMENFDLKIMNFDFAGGEPMLSKRHFQVLERLVESGRSDYVSLHYNTNGTIFPEQAIKLWQNFRRVEIAVSIDDIGKRFEYQRSGAKWDEVQSNLKKYFELQSSRFKIALHLAVNIQNVYYLPEICDWIDTLPFNSVHFSTVYDPQWISIHNLTFAAKDLVIPTLKNYQAPNQTLQNFITSIASAIQNQTADSNQNDFIDHMNELDHWRKQSFINSHPEIAMAMYAR